MQVSIDESSYALNVHLFWNKGRFEIIPGIRQKFHKKCSLFARTIYFANPEVRCGESRKNFVVMKCRMDLFAVPGGLFFFVVVVPGVRFLECGLCGVPSVTAPLKTPCVPMDPFIC